jgi:peptide/nickel transport system permease protein
MRRWLLLQLGQASLAAWAIASLVFLLSRMLAGGTEEALLSEANDLQTRTIATSPTARQALRQRLGS